MLKSSRPKSPTLDFCERIQNFPLVKETFLAHGITSYHAFPSQSVVNDSSIERSVPAPFSCIEKTRPIFGRGYGSWKVAATVFVLNNVPGNYFGVDPILRRFFVYTHIFWLLKKTATVMFQEEWSVSMSAWSSHPQYFADANSYHNWRFTFQIIRTRTRLWNRPH